MKLSPRLLPLFPILFGIYAAAQVTSDTDGLQILKRVSRHYADAKSYHIRVVEETTYSNELQRGWNKTLLEAAEGPGGRLHYEGRSGWGGALQVSDGTTMWRYRPDDKTYTKTAMSNYDPNTAFYVNSESNIGIARGLWKGLASFSDHYKSATRLPDEAVSLDGRLVQCYVVRVHASDQKRSTDPTYEETVWIDKAQNTFVKSVSHSQPLMFTGTGHISQVRDTTTTYVQTYLTAPAPDALFTFVPPADAKLVDAFPNPMETQGGASLKGQLMPELKLTTDQGQTLSTTSFRGEVLVLDLWATWCAPCVKTLEGIASLYKDAKDKGVVLITIDQDEDADTARALLTKKGYQWTNVHDPGEIANALGGNGGIPRTIVVNREGKVIYDRESGAEADIRSAIAALGPEFASLAPPKKETPPCVPQVSAAAK